MTSRNIPWSCESAGREEPFLLKPAVKNYLWGGRRLKDEFCKESEMFPLAETWECSTHPNGSSMIASGRFTGLPLSGVLQRHPEFLGTHPGTKGELPILLKLIDAKQDLSIQVHPDDAYAKTHENGQLGKSEMWYILDAEPGAELICGLRHNLDRSALRRSIMEGTIEKYVQKIPVKKNDVFYMEAGTIHAVGAGILLAEVQESSDLTYRLYDYHRIGQDGKERELHVEKALETADLRSRSRLKQPLRVLQYQKGYASELLCRCKYFEVYRLLVNTERCRELVRYQADKLSFRVLLCIQGCGMLRSEKGNPLLVFKGDCIFFPANSAEVRLHGRAQFLEVRC
ncbi:MAG: class I mannose-6-phosphate isomerase [Oscillibacter sp.]|nr:class I mannose-6-phosphate isomerase [Oscillibacter sp.]